MNVTFTNVSYKLKKTQHLDNIFQTFHTAKWTVKAENK